MKKSGIDATSELACETYEWAKRRMQGIDQNVDDAAARARAVNDRTKGTVFERFGQERLDLAQKLKDDPPYGGAKIVKIGSLLVVAGLTLYETIRHACDASSEDK